MLETGWLAGGPLRNWLRAAGAKILRLVIRSRSRRSVVEAADDRVRATTARAADVRRNAEDPARAAPAWNLLFGALAPPR